MIPVLEQMSEEETVGEPRCSFFKTPREKKKRHWVVGFKDFLCSPVPGEMIQFDLYFSDGLKPPTR